MDSTHGPGGPTSLQRPCTRVMLQVVTEAATTVHQSWRETPPDSKTLGPDGETPDELWVMRQSSTRLFTSPLADRIPRTRGPHGRSGPRRRPPCLLRPAPPRARLEDHQRTPQCPDAGPSTALAQEPGLGALGRARVVTCAPMDGGSSQAPGRAAPPAPLQAAVSSPALLFQGQVDAAPRSRARGGGCTVHG